LFIGNLPYSATEVDVRAHMASVAPPVAVVLPMDRETGRPRGFAFVDYDDLPTATEVIRRLNGNLFLGRTLSVSEARPREDRGARPPMGGGFSGPPRVGPALGGPARMAPSPGGPASREKNFGPPAPPKGRRSAAGKPRGDGGPKGPIKVRGGGRVYDVDDPKADLDDVKALVEPVEEYDDFATSRPGEDDSDSDND
jgi:RNA recognition motif-containing protein